MPETLQNGVTLHLILTSMGFFILNPEPVKLSLCNFAVKVVLYRVFQKYQKSCHRSRDFFDDVIVL